MNRFLAISLGLGLGACITSCSRQPEPQIRDGETYGITKDTFRGRWWHYYERGVSWSLGGFSEQAEADFRASLKLRQTDARRARTYGFHFVQCFAHRELGALLLERGAYDEAEFHLRTSLEQEPSAKATFLLEKLKQLRDGGAAPATAGLTIISPTVAAVAQRDDAQLPANPAVPALELETDDISIDIPPLALRSSQLQLADVEPVARAEAEEPTSIAVRGSFNAMAGIGLFAVQPNGSKKPIETADDGSFSAELAANETLTAIATNQENESIALVQPAQIPAIPSLRLNGPADGAVINGATVYYRFQAEAKSGLRSLQISDQSNNELASLSLSGVVFGSTIAIPVSPETTELRFTVLDDQQTEHQEIRSVVVRPNPAQLRKIRAAAFLIPLQTPEDGAGLKASDDPLLAGAVVDNGRFRVLDDEADTLLQRELTLVEAGYVDRITAARAGRRLQARYVVTGTVRRGRGDVECYLRLIHSESGTVVATADAYIQRQAAADDARFFELLAGRLRQVFPVIAAEITKSEDRITSTLPTASAQSGMRFYAIEKEADITDEQGTVLIPGKIRIVGELSTVGERNGAVELQLIDGSLPEGPVKVISE